MCTTSELRRATRCCVLAGAIAILSVAYPAAAAKPAPQPKFTQAVAFDVSPAARDLPRATAPGPRLPDRAGVEPYEVRPEPNVLPPVIDRGFTGDGALDRGAGLASSGGMAGLASFHTLEIPGPLANFEGISNQDNFNIFGFRVNPPDPVGDVGPNHYVEMVNLAFAVYDKAGNTLLAPTDIGALWAGFAIEDCTDPSGDPIVLYDQLEDRWILSQFTTRGLDPDTPEAPFYNCVAISQTGDPTGAYFRYAFITQADLEDGGFFFPDYPKYGVWTDSYILTTRDFGFVNRYGISVYALEKRRMVAGNPNARAVQFFLEFNPVPLHLIGDGLLPPDIDGSRKPMGGIAAPIVGTMDDGGGYGAPFDGINVFELTVNWSANPQASLVLSAQLPVAQFDSIFPCHPTSSRDCLPQPGISNPRQFLDILSYRQRPTHRLAYRNFGGHESFVTNQSVEASPATAGVRWYEIRRTNGAYSIHQQGTFAPDDGVHRWMGSAAMDRQGNLAVGYSVVDDTSVFPGIRYAGRLASDPLGDLSLGEATIIDGTGVQTTFNSRWGDYTSLNIDPTDDCTFWYVNEYYTAAGQASSPAGWQTRIASFRLPGC